MPSSVSPRPVRYSRAQRAFGRAELLLEPGGRDLVQLDQLGALAALGGLLGRGEFALRQRDAAFDGDGFDGFGEADVFDLLDEGEDVAGFVAAEAVVELAARR